jgi:hypothetical protein
MSESVVSVYSLPQFLIDTFHAESVRVSVDDKHLTITSADEPSGNNIGERVFGALKGKMWIAPDFDEPLEDFAEYM